MKLTKSLIKITNNDLDSLISKFNLEDAKIYNDTSIGKFIIAFIDEKNEQNLNSNWKNINNLLSEYLEEFINDKCTRWNVYIVYLVNANIKLELKYKIENNTFFARKIVEDNYTLDLSDKNIKNLISNHISFDDLGMKGNIPNREDYSSNSIVYKKLSDIDTLDSDKIEDILKSLEKDDSNEV